MLSGIYQIKNIINNKKYIGSSIDIQKRWRDHRRYLRGDYHKNQYLQNAWNKYGKENFEFEIVLICEESELEYYEQRFLDNIVRWDYDYNISKHVDCPTRGITGEDHYRYGKQLSKETKQKMSKAHKGKILSEETKEKISKALSGKNHYMYGKYHTKEAKEKMSKAHKGRKFSEERRENISKSLKGNTRSAKLTEAQVLEIRERYTGEYGQQVELAKEYGVSNKTIYMIVHRINWTHI